MCYRTWQSRSTTTPSGLAGTLGRAVYHTLFRWLPTTLLGVLLFSVRLPADAGRWGCFLLSMMLAVWLSFGLRFLYNVAAVRLLDGARHRLLWSRPPLFSCRAFWYP